MAITVGAVVGFTQDETTKTIDVTLTDDVPAGNEGLATYLIVAVAQKLGSMTVSTRGEVEITDDAPLSAPYNTANSVQGLELGMLSLNSSIVGSHASLHFYAYRILSDLTSGDTVTVAYPDATGNLLMLGARLHVVTGLDCATPTGITHLYEDAYDGSAGTETWDATASIPLDPANLFHHVYAELVVFGAISGLTGDTINWSSPDDPDGGSPIDEQYSFEHDLENEFEDRHYAYAFEVYGDDPITGEYLTTNSDGNFGAGNGLTGFCYGTYRSGLGCPGGESYYTINHAFGLSA